MGNILNKNVDTCIEDSVGEGIDGIELNKQVLKGKNVVDNILNNHILIPEIKECIKENLLEEQILAIGLEYLAYDTMTTSKITVIGYMLGVEDIKRIGAKKLAEITIEELNTLV